MTTIEWTVTDEMQLLGEQLAEEFAVESKLTRFPTGAAMLDVRANGRTFVMAYSPKDGFGVDEVQADEGLGTGYRHTFEELSKSYLLGVGLFPHCHRLLLATTPQ